MIGRLTAVAGLVLGAPSVLAAQAVWQADVRIQSIDATFPARGMLAIRIVVANDHDEARNVRLSILLPVGAGPARLAPGCRPSPSPVPNLTARIACELGDLPVRGLREVTAMVPVAPSSPGRRVAAFVESDTPDPFPSNNYAERAIP